MTTSIVILIESQRIHFYMGILRKLCPNIVTLMLLQFNGCMSNTERAFDSLRVKEKRLRKRYKEKRKKNSLIKNNVVQTKHSSNSSHHCSTIFSSLSKIMSPPPLTAAPHSCPSLRPSPLHHYLLPPPPSFLSFSTIIRGIN